MMQKADQLALVKAVLAREWGCDVGTFDCDRNVWVPSNDTFFEMLTFGRNAVLRGHADIADWCAEHLLDRQAWDVMDGDMLYDIEYMLRQHGYKLCGEHVRYLHTRAAVIEPPTGYIYRWFERGDMPALYAHEGFVNALNYRNDCIAYGAYDGDELIALAGADDRYAQLWQIGIDVLAAHRNRGLAAYLVHALAEEIGRRGVVAFYTTWVANLGSTNTALAAGFTPSWMGYYADAIR